MADSHFTTGLWNVGHPGGDPFGDPVRTPPDLRETVARLGEIGCWGVNLHDDDLVPVGTSAAERDRRVRDLRSALEEHGLVVGFVSTDLFHHPVFRDGAFTSNDPRVRAYAVQKAMRALDLGAELGTKMYVQWGGREGTEVDASKDPRDALARWREAMDYLCSYIRDQGYDMRVALEPKPNEPRGDLYLPTTGHMLAFIETLEHPDMVGVNPEVAHEVMLGLSIVHAVGQALDAGKLFHLDLNDQRPGRFDQDLRFGAENLKPLLYVVWLLEEAGFDGPLAFDVKPRRTDDVEGAFDLVKGCIRSYRLLQQKVKALREDREIREHVERLRASMREDPYGLGRYSAEGAERLKAEAFDPEALTRGHGYDALDQAVVEVLLGAR